jgi:hypothetical protein
MKVADQNFIAKEIEDRLNAGNAFYLQFRIFYDPVCYIGMQNLFYLFIYFFACNFV